MIAFDFRPVSAPIGRGPGFGRGSTAASRPPQCTARLATGRTGAAHRPGRSRVTASPDRPGDPSAAVTGGAPRGFWRGQRGAATIGAALSISILVTAFASLMGIVHKIYIEDRMERGARAGARAVSLLATAPASAQALERIVCAAVRRELWPGLAEGESDECTDRWTVEVRAFPTPRALGGDAPRADGGSPGGENEDLVLVRLTRPWKGWLPGGRDAEAGEGGEEAEGSEEATSSTPGEPASTGIVAAALARNERAVVVEL